ncbi:MAG: YceI family protein [Bacteroidia bacterium]
MKKLSILCISITALLLLPAFSLIQEVNSWKIADDYMINFSGRGAQGSFSTLQGSISYDPENLVGSSIDVHVDVRSIDTGSKGKNKHAKNNSWLDAEQFGKIRFVSKRFESQGEGMQVIGDLTMHGVTREITIPYTFSNQTFEGEFTVDRKDYDIKGPLMGFAVGNEFNIALKVPVK